MTFTVEQIEECAFALEDIAEPVSKYLSVGEASWINTAIGMLRKTAEGKSDSINEIVREVCEREPYGDYHEDAVCLSVSDLRLILETRLDYAAMKRREAESVPSDDVIKLVYKLRTLVKADSGASASRESYEAACNAEDALISAIRSLASPPSQPSTGVPDGLAIVIEKLWRFFDCAEDEESGGCNIGRHWFDALTTIGLLERVQRSPAIWEITPRGEALLAAATRSP